MDEAALAYEMGISSASYSDLEACDEELDDLISLGAVLKLCKKLRVTPEALLGIEHSTEKLQPEEFRIQVQRQLESGELSLSHLDSLNFNVRPFLADSSKIGDLPIYCVRYLCHFSNTNWQNLIV